MITLQNMTTGDQFQLTANMVVNAGGPWVRSILEASGLHKFSREGEEILTAPNIRLVKGSHIIVPNLYEGEHSYILQQADGRIVFTIPYEEQYSLIGTTGRSV